jgi:dTDP-4-amino-4,6-dideoxygalactose transaminase
MPVASEPDPAMPGAAPESLGASVPAFSLSGQIAALRPELDAAWARVLDSGQFILGPEVEGLEREAAELLGAGVHAAGVANGSDALYLALAALDVGRGDDVITTPFTFFATAGSILRTGARPVFADIDPDTFNLDTAGALARVTPRTRAILPVHLFGLMADVATMGRHFSGPIVEDAAQAILASRDGRVAGAAGRLGCFSFYPTKNWGAFGDAGLVAGRDPDLVDRVRRLGRHGARRKYYHEELGVNSRLDAIQAAVLRVKLGHVAEWTARRQRLASRYTELIRAEGLADWVRPQAVPSGARHVYHQYTVRAVDRDQLSAHLSADGIGTTVYYPHPLHLMPVFQELGHRPGDLPEAERLCTEALSLPMFPELQESQVDRVVESIRRFYRGRGPSGA